MPRPTGKNDPRKDVRVVIFAADIEACDKLHDSIPPSRK